MNLIKCRQCFYNYDNLPIRAGGVMFYYINKNKTIDFLMMECNGKLEDFGGRTDYKDINFKHTVAREVEEESNCIFTKEKVLELISYEKPIYSKHSKYIIFFIELKIKINPKIFGNKEYYDNISRSVSWINVSFLKNNKNKYKLNPRLKCKSFYDKITEIEKNINNEITY